jgi:osmotically-inducible protein OsmY
MIRKDEQIKKDVVDQLYWDSRVDASNIAVKVDNGIVNLEGNTFSYKAKNTALKIAWDIIGVNDVINNITLSYLDNLPSDDEVITAINSMLKWNTNIDDSNIKVIVSDGEVVIEGTLETCWKVDYAESIISDIHGVIGVENKLGVVPGKDIMDRTIAKVIVAAIDRNLLMDANDIIVKVNNGRVTIGGRVPTFMARRTAYEIVTNTLGVTDIKNDLIVDRELFVMPTDTNF